VELDIRASFLTIYYAKLGHHLDVLVDPYAVEGLPTAMPWTPRDIVKAWIVSAFGAGKLPLRWGNRIIQEYKEYAGRKLANDFPIKMVQQAVLTKHPLLEQIGSTTLNSLDLMFLESQAVISTINKLIELGIPSLPVHDSLIVKRQDAEAAKASLEYEYESIIGVRPFVRVKWSTN
jgi:hypothetical protein